jgi:hypothetical protein
MSSHMAIAFVRILEEEGGLPLLRAVANVAGRERVVITPAELSPALLAEVRALCEARITVLEAAAFDPPREPGFFTSVIRFLRNRR